MSLINEMLKDLEARTGQDFPAQAVVADLAPVRARLADGSGRLALLALLALSALLGVGALAATMPRLLGPVPWPEIAWSRATIEPAAPAAGLAGSLRDDVRGLQGAGSSGQLEQQLPTQPARLPPEQGRPPEQRHARVALPAAPSALPAATDAPVPAGAVAHAEARVHAEAPSRTETRAPGRAPLVAGAPAPVERRGKPRLRLAYALGVKPRTGDDGLALPSDLRAEANRLNEILVRDPPAAVDQAPGRGTSSAADVDSPSAVGSSHPRVAPASAGSDLRKRALPETAQQRSQALFRKGLGALRAGRTVEGERALRRALEEWPGHVQAREVLAARVIRAGRLHEALALLAAGDDTVRTQPGLAKLEARVLVELGRLDDALEALARASSVDDPEYHALRAATLQRLARHAEAVAAYREALARRPDAGVWWMGMAISLEGAGALGNALDAYIRAARQGELHPEVRRFVEARIRALRG
jgi:Flp pilus assembly protein TadD